MEQIECPYALSNRRYTLRKNGRTVAAGLQVDVKDVKMDASSRTSAVVALLDARDGDNELFACVADVADVEIPIRNVNSSSESARAKVASWCAMRICPRRLYETS